MPRGLARILPHIAVLALGTGLLGSLQFSVPHLAGADGYHHLRFAARVREHGPL